MLAPAWTEYATGSEIEHFAEFCRNHCVQSVDDWEGEPLELEPWQMEMMGEALAFDGQGLPTWRRVVFVISRKNGKTSLLAAYAIYRLLTSSGSPEVLLAAATDKQAGRLFDAALAFLRNDPTLRELLVDRDYKGEIERRDGKGIIYRVSAESTDLDGFNASLVVCDELHAWETPGKKTAFAKLVSGGGARKKRRQLFTITTAGAAETREDSILGRMLDGALTKGRVERRPGLEVARQADAATLVYNFTAPTTDPADAAAMKLANPASWITEEFLAEAAASDDLTHSEKLRYHGGVWAASDDAFISTERWAGLADADLDEPGDAEVFLGFDGSRNYDTTVAAWAWRLDDGRVAVKTHVWATRSEAPHHDLVEGREIDFDAFEEWVEDELFGRFNVVEAAYDPRYLIRSMQLLERRVGTDRIAPVEPQSKLMRDAIAAFHQAVVDGRLVHDGDPVLSQHVAAARASQDEKGWVVRKRVQRRPIDALIAATLAVWRCTLEHDEPVFAWGPGV